MHETSGQPEPLEKPQRQRHQAREEREERFGPLELLRTSKADGRALLLFSRRGDADRDQQGNS